MDTKIELRVIGLTFSQAQSGAYALLLGEINGNRKLPVIVGVLEAQSIATALEGMESPRPQTHDLFSYFVTAAHYMLDHVLIYKFENGIFYSKVVFVGSNERIVLDARTSDAVALALRLQAFIYVLPEIMDVAGIVFEEDVETPEAGEVENLSIEKLNEQLQKAIEEENYELASRLRDEINEKN